MAIEQIHVHGAEASKGRKFWMITVVLLGMASAAGALMLPFFYESSSILYKFGLDKMLLRSGKMAGLVAMLLLIMQLALAGRIAFFDRIFSLPALCRTHRIGAFLLGTLALAHPILVFAPDGILMIPLESRYWPEWIGVVLLLTICAQIILSNWRSLFWRKYERWRLFHRIAGIIAVLLAGVHVLYVSDTFEADGLPRLVVFLAISAYGLLLIWTRLQNLHIFRHPFRVQHIDRAGQGAYSVTLEPASDRRFAYLPGQFAFIELDSDRLCGQAHPFTLSSTPSRPETLQLIIRECGDWTAGISSLQPGILAWIQGPFGRFSHLLDTSEREIIMIAGGIGITPMLSMLRYMHDHQDKRHVTLIWSNRTKQHLFGAEELNTMARELTSFRWIPIFTRDNATDAIAGRLESRILEELLQKCSRKARIYLCGPPAMVLDVRKQLRQVGFSASSIIQEAFNL